MSVDDFFSGGFELGVGGEDNDDDDEESSDDVRDSSLESRLVLPPIDTTILIDRISL